MRAVAFALLAFVALVLVAHVHAGGGHDDDDDDDGTFNYVEEEYLVTKTLNRYVQKLNGLVEFAQGPACTGADVNVPGITAWANDLVDTFFSRNFQGFTMHQSTNGVPDAPGSQTLNITIGSPANPEWGQPAIHNAAELHDYLKVFYRSFAGFSMSTPFHWLLSVPVVNIKQRDPAYNGKTIAYVIANNENKGYHCNSTTHERTFQLQFNLYVHEFVKEGSNWKFIHFHETNKNKLLFTNITALEPIAA